MKENESVELVVSALGLGTEDRSFSPTRQWLIEKVNDLINQDFPRLISLLYRADISESRLRSILQEHPGVDAARIITDLLIERQIQKAESRKKYSQKDEDIDEDEKW